MTKKYKSLCDVYKDTAYGEFIKRVAKDKVSLKEYAEVIIQKNPPHGEVKDFRVSDDTAEKISNAITKEPNQKKIIDFLNGKGFTEKSFKGRGFNAIVDTIIEAGEQSVESFINFIQNESKPTILSNLTGNLLDIGTKAGISAEIIKLLSTLNLLDNTNNAVGPGEIAIGLIFSDVRNSSTKGDLELGGKKVEVKGSGGRMGLQPGRSPQTVSPLVFVLPFIKNNKEALAQYNNIVLNSKYGKRIREKTYDVIYNMLVSYNFVKDKKSIYENIVEELDKIYSYGNNYAKEYITIPLLESADYLKIKTALFKLYAKGYLEKNKIDGYLINVSKDNLDYIVITLQQLLEPETGYIDTGKVVAENFRFNDLYPGISIGKITN